MGARGSVGKLVLEQLLAQGLSVRASARRPVPGQFPDGVDVFAADLTVPASLLPAFEGAGRVFLYANDSGVDGVIDAEIGRASCRERVEITAVAVSWRQRECR